ncbi:conserved hypothetical protein-Uncharacterized ATPase [hydrothermal vent metagenome]|uniref:AAA domain-containing protein n=1 Tax=hydrothermal vent metagenome TaxID=652676 RepID=A0A1W1EI35_9ZZZZ
MQILEQLQTQPYLNNNFITRKVQIIDIHRLNIFGVRGSGKSSLVIDYINNNLKEDEYLYIDFDNPLLLINPIDNNMIDKFIKQNQITTLILDQYRDEYLSSIPVVDNIIIVSRIALKLDGYRQLELFALDYEEFIAFEKKSSTNSLNSFLKLGTLPQIVKEGNINANMLKRFLSTSFTRNEQQLLTILASFNTKNITTNQIYLYAKDRFKISKDWLYKKIKEWQDEKLITLIDNRYQKSGKKLILFDFILPKYITTNQTFIERFDNLILLAMLKHYDSFEAIGTYEYIVNETIIIVAPFDTEEHIWKKCYLRLNIYQKYNSKNIIIVTISNQYSFKIKDIEFEGLPFSEWSILSS